MSEPRSWQLLESTKACLQSISVANGYNTDVGALVSLEPAQLPDSVATVLAVALDGTRRSEDQAMRSVGELVAFNVIVKVKAGRDDAQITLHRAIADVRRAMKNRQAQFPEGVQFPVFLEASVIPPADGMTFIGALVRYQSHVRND